MAKLTTIRVEKNGNYTIMSNFHLRDKHLSLKAKGLMSYMLSLPPEWDFSVVGLSSCLAESKNTISKILKELIDKGYMERKQERQGKLFSGYSYILHELSCRNSWDTKSEDPKNEAQINTKEINTKEIKNNILSSDLDLARKTREIIVYLNEKTKKNYKTTTSKTKSLVKARLNDGFSLDDFKKVIDTKTSQWLGNAEMERYLRPETLFGGHFEGYLQEKEKEIPVPQKKKIIYEDELMEVDPWI